MTKISLLLIVCTVGSGLVSLHLVRQLRAERERSTTLQVELDRTASAAPAYKAEQLEAPDDTEPAATADTAADSPAPGVPPPTVGVVASPGAVFSTVMVDPADSTGVPEEHVKQMKAMYERQRVLMRDPAFRAAYIDQQKIGIMMMNRSLGHDLDLTDEQLAGLVDLVAEHQLRTQESSPAFWPGEPPDAATMARQAQQQQELRDAHDAAIARLLGAQKAQAYRQYERLSVARNQVMTLQYEFAMAGAPLRDEQIQQAVRIYDEINSTPDARNSMHNGWSPAPGSPPTAMDMEKQAMESMRAQNKRVRERLAGVLTEEQSRALARQQEMQIQQQEVQMRIMRAQAEAEERGDVPRAPQMQGLFSVGFAGSTG